MIDRVGLAALLFLSVSAPSAVPEEAWDSAPPREEPAPADPLPKRREWLAAHQAADGGWSPRGFEAQCKGGPCGGAAGSWESEAGTTGLVLSAFVGYGETHRTPRYGDVVRRAAARLAEIQDADGCFGIRYPERFLADHALATVAMADLCRLTGGDPAGEDDPWRPAVAKAVTFLMAERGADGGWREGDRLPESDAVTTAWALTALRTARLLGLSIDPTVFDDALAFLDGLTDPETGMVRPRPSAEPTVRATAAAVWMRLRCGADRDDPAVARGVEVLLQNRPRWSSDGEGVDPESWYLGTLACFQVGDAPWKKWNEAMKRAIVDSQVLDRASCRAGSWDPVRGPSAEMGRVAATALGVLCLEVYYRYARVFGSKAPGPAPRAPPPRARTTSAPRRPNRVAALDLDFPEPRTGFLR